MSGEPDLYQRVRYLPDAIERTTKKLGKLCAEARRLGLEELANDAWDRAIIEAQAGAKARRGSIGFGDGRE